jgi:hypothetical protein
MLKTDIAVPLDVEKILPPDQKETEDILRRENILKNVVLNIIIKNREIKKRPKLKDILTKFQSSEKKVIIYMIR